MAHLSLACGYFRVGGRDLFDLIFSLIVCCLNFWKMRAEGGDCHARNNQMSLQVVFISILFFGACLVTHKCGLKSGDKCYNLL